MSSWLAPAPSTRTRIFARNRAGTCRMRRGQHLLVVGERVRARVAGPQQHGQALARIRSPRPQWMEAVALLPGGSRSLLVRVRGDQRRVHVDDQPARQGLPGDDQPREAGRGVFDQLPHVRRGSSPGPARSSPASLCRPGRGRAGRWSRWARRPAPARAGPAPRYRSCWCAPSAIATAIDTTTTPRLSCGNVPARASAASTAAVSPHWSASFRSRTPPQCPTRPAPSSVTFRPWSQPLCCMAKSAPVPGIATCGNRVISQNQGALRLPGTQTAGDSLRALPLLPAPHP